MTFLTSSQVSKGRIQTHLRVCLPQTKDGSTSAERLGRGKWATHLLVISPPTLPVVPRPVLISPLEKERVKQTFRAVWAWSTEASVCWLLLMSPSFRL